MWGKTTITVGAAAMGVAALLTGCSDDDEGVRVSLSEWTVLPDTQDIDAGEVAFTADNEGTEPHELVIVRVDALADLPVGEDGAVEESGLSQADFIGEIEEFPAGEERAATFTLEPGTYALFCNIVETDEGEVEAHYQLGMATTITVEE